MKKINFQLYKSISGILEHIDLQSEEQLENLISDVSRTLISMGREYTSEDLKIVKRHLQSSFETTMEEDIMLANQETHHPWLNDYRARNSASDYWDRYSTLLHFKGYHKPTLLRLNKVTDDILDSLENPNKSGNWRRRGLVMGNVQSGKTANYTGLICKAADTGYKVFIVLAGSLNPLRRQTQERIDEGFLGFDSTSQKPIGVSKYTDNSNISPASFTDLENDFDIKKAKSRGLTLNNLKQPAVFVIKKNGTILKNLKNWLSTHKKDLSHYPLLLIDDESDYASVNTNKEGNDPTSINKGIREILDLFPRHSYVGYTATPFANIFINAENDDNMRQEDLFPRDFIKYLGAPENYMGPEQIFSPENQVKHLRIVDDNEDFIPLKHNKHLNVSELPPSLKESIRSFVLASAIRSLRNDCSHRSMLINCSRLTRIQNDLADSVIDYFDKLKKASKISSNLEPKEALQNKHIHDLFLTWEVEFKAGEFEWEQTQNELSKVTAPIEILKINKDSEDSLDYSPTQYPSGRSIVAIGGLSLSRGITLEGLSTSYLLRNTAMYDTLMQMGRWFGYRDIYRDLCRIYMHHEAASFYEHIAISTNELRNDLKLMNKNKSKPEYFGLRVRSHPNRLKVTAANKMKATLERAQVLDLHGRSVSTSKLNTDPAITQRNIDCFHQLNEALNANYVITKKDDIHGPELGHFWQNVSSDLIQQFLTNYNNHPSCTNTFPDPILEHIQMMDEAPTCQRWDILLRSSKTEDTKKPIGLEMNCFTRSNTNEKNFITINKSRLGSTGEEKAGLSKLQAKQVRDKSKNKNVADYEYRQKKKNPLLILYVIKPIDMDIRLPAYAACFPYPDFSQEKRQTITYRYNSIYKKEMLKTIQKTELEEPDDE
jgi:hypothetical protein